MENIYDIRIKEKLLYILPDDYSIFAPSHEIVASTAIAVNLYYEDNIERYFSNLDRLCNEYVIYIISSKQIILDKAGEYFKGNSNIKLLKKENRGRDVSALLVSFREIALKYKYICFIHDKKAKNDLLEEDVNNWIKNLWENVIATKEYVNNILQMFEGNPDIGMLVPPEPLGECFAAWYGDAWGPNFNITVQLCEELNVVDCNLDKDKYPITLGTVFWARTQCLSKLLLKEWTYEDFPEEPMPVDGTISHAIERIWGYVVQDAGFKVGTVMTTAYAQWSMLFAQNGMRRMYSILRDEMGIQNIRQVKNLEKQEDVIKKYFATYNKVYLYGSGVYGRGLLKRIRQWNLLPIGFIVGNGRKMRANVDGLKIYELQEIDLSEDIGIIIAVNYNLQNDIEQDLKAAGFSNFIEGYI